MDLQILNEEKQPLFGRKTVIARISFEQTTPSRDSVRKSFCAKQKTDEKLTVIKKINSDFGACAADVTVYVYDDEKSLKTVEPEYSQKRNAVPEKEEAPAEAPKEEEKKVESSEEKADDKEEAKEENPSEDKKE
jgi:ribosomal protein S24E